MDTPPPDSPSDPFEALLAECIERLADDGPAALESLCEAHPEHAARLRERMGSLQRLGLLGDTDAPRTVGPYRILGLLGRGGMSTVYLAHDQRLGRRVALKLGLAPLAENDRASLRFEREIAAVLQLQHPCIVQTFDVGQAQGRSYFTMEYVDGTTLARVIETLREEGVPPEQLTGESVARATLAGRPQLGDAPPSSAPPTWRARYVEVVCRLVLDVADALAHAHAHGIVHRDVKPSNIMVRTDGRAQLFDLGLALLQDQPALSASGDFAGTPFYASPEQIAGRSKGVDGRTDVYSLGVTLYELLNLRRPFEGQRTAEVLKKIQVEEPRSPRARNPDVPRDLETITLTAIEKDPGRRYASAEAMAADLRRFLELRPIHAQPTSPLERAGRRLRRNPALAALSALLLLFLVGLPIGLLWANAAIRSQRDRATEAASEASRQAELNAEVTEFLVELYHLAGSDTPGRGPGRGPDRAADGESITVLEFLERGVERISTDFEDQPLVRAALLEATGRVYANLGLEDEALPLLARSLAVRQRELGEDHLDVARLLALLGSIHSGRGDAAAAAGLARRSLEVLDRLEAKGARDDRCRAENHVTLAACVEQAGDLDPARSHLARALALLSAREGPDSVAVARVLERSAAIAERSGDTRVALDELRRALTIRRGQWSPDPPAIAHNLELQAAVLDARQDPSGAARLRAEARGLRGGKAGAGAPAGSPDAPYPFDLTPWDPRFDERFQDGITALQSGNGEAAIAAFEQCMELRPRHRSCAYNIACGYALAGDVERGLEWWSRAVDHGYGQEPYAVDVSLKDADFDALRGDPRWHATHERMLALRARAERQAAEPRVYLPDALEPDTRWPLLVVLHDQGASPDAVLTGAWRGVAERLGAALLAPSGRILADSQEGEGMRWYGEADDYLLRSWHYEKPIVDAVLAFAEEHPIDREHVLVAGEGHAALLASDLALSAPGLFRGALLENGPVHPAATPERVGIAAAVGLRMEILLDERRPVSGRPPEARASELPEALDAWLRATDLAPRVRVRLFDGHDAPTVEARRVEAVRALLPGFPTRD